MGDFSEAAIGRSVPGKSLIKNLDPLSRPFPVARQDCAWWQAICTRTPTCAWKFRFVRCSRGDAVEEALSFAIEIAQSFSLQAISNHPVQQMAWQVIRGFAAKDGMPSRLQTTKIEVP